ncbi:permease [Halobacillus salinus]|uniref:Permease n=1 Tax=Halobacillus salinus TaxID=192814 RepID=A0A4Z0H254_9BACI|nr:permease [Halobacillus salinus]TGB04442.1 permease [Halobacillus salinus]
MTKDHYPSIYIGAGVILGLQCIFILTIGILAGDLFPVHALPLLSTAIMAFCMSYLHPQFKQKDERMRLIRYKGLFFSFFFMLGVMSILLFLIEATAVSLNASEVIQLLITLYMSSVFISWVVIAKKH